MKKLAIDKSSWDSVKFGDVVYEPKETSKDPIKERIEHVVGLEHIDSDSIHLRRSASIEGVTTFSKKFSSGDVLFGRRRAYLQKAAQAKFSGICSGDITVFRAKKNLIPELLPFIVNNERFFNYAVKHSAGGLSPRVKFKDLANYEFLLPPKEEQAELAELLWAMDEVVEKKIKLEEIALTNFHIVKSTLLFEGLNKDVSYSTILKRNVANGWRVTSVGELIDEKLILKIQDGNHGELHPKSSDYSETGIPFVMANTLVDGRVDIEKSQKLPQAITDKLRIGFALPGDVLLSHKGTVGQVALVPEEIDFPYLMLTPQVTYYRTEPSKLLNKFLYYIFSTQYFQDQITRLSSQSTRAYVGITAQREFKMTIPTSLKEQHEIINILAKLENNQRLLNEAIYTSKSLQKSLINQIF